MFRMQLAARCSAQFWRWHLLLPLGLLLLASLVLEGFAVDRQVAVWLYHWEGDRWALRHAWATNQLLHTGGKRLSLIVALTCAVGLVASFFSAKFKPYRPVLGYLVLSAIGASLLVSLFKQLLAVSCPWEFSLFGGDLAYVSVWEQLWLRTGAGCFPAAHASAGYAWVGMYFAGYALHARWRYWALGVALVAGLVLGVGQQVRGAHFISHDLWTLALCWFTALSAYVLLLAPRSRREPYIEGVV